MRHERSADKGRKHRDPLLLSLPLPHHDRIGADVNVLHAESEALQETEAGTLQQAGHDPGDALKPA